MSGFNHDKFKITVEDGIFWVTPHEVDEWRVLIEAKQVWPLGNHGNLANGLEFVGFGGEGKKTAGLEAAGLEPFDGSLRHELNTHKRPQRRHNIRLNTDLGIDEFVLIVVLAQSVVALLDVGVDCEPQTFSALATKDLVLSLQIGLLRCPWLVYRIFRQALGFFLGYENFLGRGDFGFRLPSVAIFKLDEDVAADDLISLWKQGQHHD